MVLKKSSDTKCAGRRFESDRELQRKGAVVGETTGFALKQTFSYLHYFISNGIWTVSFFMFTQKNNRKSYHLTIRDENQTIIEISLCL